MDDFWFPDTACNARDNAWNDLMAQIAQQRLAASTHDNAALPTEPTSLSDEESAD